MLDETKSYSLPLQTLPSLDLQHHIDDLLEIQDFIEKRGIKTVNTRIERYIEFLRQASINQSINPSDIFKHSTTSPFRHSTDWMLYVLREVHELMWILKGIKKRVPLGIDDKLKMIVSGRDFAVLDTNSNSRNTQFELRIASYFCQAGYDVDISTETDIIATSKRQAFYIECKRVGSEKQLEKRLSEAKRQLSRRIPPQSGKLTIVGCIAADVTKVAFSHNGLTFGMVNEHSRDAIREKLINISNVVRKMSLFHDCPSLLNYWLQIHIPSLIVYPPTVFTRFSSYHIFRNSMNRQERKAIKVFRNIFESASQGDIRESPAQTLTPRTTVSFPAGTIYGIKKEIIEKFLKEGKAAKIDINEEVARLTINDKTYTFSFWDFTMVIPMLSNGWQEIIAEDPKAQLEMIAIMYAQCLPYENLDNALRSN